MHEERFRYRRMASLAALSLLAGACSGPDQTELDARALAELEAKVPELRTEPVPEPRPSKQEPGDLAAEVLETIAGEATYYADIFEGRTTASGIPFRQHQLVAAHRDYPFGTVLRVINEENDQSVNVRVVDRGPFGSHDNQERTVIDLSRRAAERLDFIAEGRVTVTVEVLEWGEGVQTG